MLSAIQTRTIRPEVDRRRFETSSRVARLWPVAFVMAPRVEQIQPGLGGWKYVVGVVFAIVLYLAHSLTRKGERVASFDGDLDDYIEASLKQGV